jgi:hypothetical protein
MNAADILTAIQASGAALRVEGDSLVASNASRIAPEIKAAIRTNKLQIITALLRAPDAPTCAVCGAADDLWHLDSPSGPITVHKECAEFLPKGEPVAPSVAAGGPDGGCQVEIIELPQAQRYQKVFAILQLEAPAHIPEDRWRQCLQDGSKFLAIWGEQAAALGWSNRDLFGLHQPPGRPHPSYSRLSRYDCLGLCWALQGRPVTMLTADSATIKTISGTLNFYRHNRPGLGPVGDSVEDFK